MGNGSVLYRNYSFLVPMRWLVLVLLVIGILDSSEVLGCQYKENITSKEPVSQLYNSNGTAYKNPIFISDFVSGESDSTDCDCVTSFKITNLIDTEIHLKPYYSVNFNLEGSSSIQNMSTKSYFIAPSKERIIYTGEPDCQTAGGHTHY